MSDLVITQAKPNPSGKDRMGGTVPSTQLAGEWVDFMNVGHESYNLAEVELQHAAYTPSYPKGVWAKVMGFQGSLPAGKVVRVHSGGELPLSSMPEIDVMGADYHLFTGKGYVWNNAKSDWPRLVSRAGGMLNEIDKARYAAYPPEGKILTREGETLV